ncbi:MAG: VWA domain-containing protein [Acidiferrobacterales bacterium]|nr:VWA domain-containing protein [Acidiferrobacterales bacterium]
MNDIGTDVGNGQFVANLVHFGRILRSSGLPVGTGRILDAVQAVRLVGVANREDFYWALHAVLVNHPRQRHIFDQAFHIFWKNPRIFERSISALLPEVRTAQSDKSSRELARRLTESLYPGTVSEDMVPESEEQIELRASLTFSDRERLQTTDFDSMSGSEMEEAKKAIATMRSAFDRIPTRRYQVDSSGNRLDMRRTLKSSMRGGADTITLIRSKRKSRQVPVVLLCDISGSMSEYSRMMLHFGHVLTLSRKEVACFVFGTNLTNITRQLRTRDVDCAMDEIADSVADWYGGTKIGECLKDFNFNWARRLPLHSAVVLLVTDGLDRSESGDLESQIGLLQRSCRKLIWLNPLLRYDEFQPKVSGIRKMLPHVDAFLPVHNLVSLSDLTHVLGSGSRTAANRLNQNRSYWRRRLSEQESLQPAQAVL